MALSSRALWHPSQTPSGLFDADLALAQFLQEDLEEGEIRSVNNDDPDEFEEGEIFNDGIDEIEEGEIRYGKDDNTDEFEEGEIRDDCHDDSNEMEQEEICDGNADDSNEMEEGEIRDGNDDDSDDFEEMDIWDGNDDATDASDYDRDEDYAISLQEAQEPYLRVRMDISIFLRTHYTDPEEFPYEQMLTMGDEFRTYNKGLSPQKIAALPYKTHNVKDDKTDTCVICQFDYKDRESLIDLDCKHSYHRECITQWLQINNVCPLCKREVSLKA